MPRDFIVGHRCESWEYDSDDGREADSLSTHEDDTIEDHISSASGHVYLSAHEDDTIEDHLSSASGHDYLDYMRPSATRAYDSRKYPAPLSRRAFNFPTSGKYLTLLSRSDIARTPEKKGRLRQCEVLPLSKEKKYGRTRRRLSLSTCSDRQGIRHKRKTTPLSRRRVDIN